MRALHPESLDIELIRTHTQGLAEIAASAPADTPVPTCGDWDLGDLTFHLFEVQHFWTHIIGNRPVGPDDYDRPARPADLAGSLRSTNDALVDLLAAADPADHAWSWSQDQTVGFTIRRQIHEAVIHHLDGVLAVGTDRPTIGAGLAADGIDELVDVMLTGPPEWASFDASGPVVRLGTTDSADEWTMRLGSLSGTAPDSGTTYEDLAAAELADGDLPVDVAIAGTALEVLLWMWGRGPIDGLEVIGDATAAASLRSLVAETTQ